ncbi:MAG: restriction endonuclease subunit S [Coriobacteriia bacterium]|nr:restriction endonuclease subunit S [Coriobacteriia bacterium]
MKADAEAVRVLERVPEGWRVLPLRRFADVRRGTADKTIVEGERLAHLIQYTDVYYKSEQRADDDYLTISVSENEWRSARTQRGDLLVTGSSETIDDIGHSTYVGEGLSDHVFGADVLCIRPHPTALVPGYGKYLMENSIYLRVFSQLSRGVTRFRFSMDDFKNVPYALPPAPAQVMIRDFLDGETSRIDALIYRKQRFIDLLVEKRASLATQRSTRGINAKALMRDWPLINPSQVPAHWEVLRAKFVLRERDVRSVDGNEELLTVSHITGVTRRSEKRVYMFMAETNEGYKTCRAGDLAINTMWAYQGAAGIAPCDGIVSPSYNVYSFTRRVDPAYFDLLVRSRPLVAEFEARSTGIWKSRLRLYPSEFLDIPLPVPPIDEQTAIVRLVAKETAKIDALVDKTRASIDLLSEHRTSLISAAVTGQINIPGTETSEDVA